MKINHKLPKFHRSCYLLDDSGRAKPQSVKIKKYIHNFFLSKNTQSNWNIVQKYQATTSYYSIVYNELGSVQQSVAYTDQVNYKCMHNTYTTVI